MPGRKSSSSARRFSSLFLGTPGPHEADRDRQLREASPTTTAQLASLRKSLFSKMSSEDIRSLRNRTIPAAPSTAGSSDLDPPPVQDLNLEEAPRNSAGHQTPPRRHNQPPEDDDVATRIATAIENVLNRRADQPPAQRPQNAGFRPPDIPMDPTWNWQALSAFPSDTNFPVPCDGQVAKHLQLIVTSLAAMSARDQHEAKFVLKMAADWPDLEKDLKFAVWQRVYTFACVARWGWATAIHFASASGGGPNDAFVPEGLQPIVRQPAQPQQPRGRRRYNNQPQGQGQQQQQQQPAPQPQPPQQAPAVRGRRILKLMCLFPLSLFLVLSCS